MIDHLRDPQVRKISEDGWYADGAGLFLRINGGRKRWIYRYEIKGRRRELGLGSADQVAVADAREARDQVARLVRQGRDPLEERRQEEERKRALAAAAAAARITFGEFARSVAPANAPTAAKGRKAWLAMMTRHVGDLANVAPVEITTEHVLKALKPYWLSRQEAGRTEPKPYLGVADEARRFGPGISEFLAACISTLEVDAGRSSQPVLARPDDVEVFARYFLRSSPRAQTSSGNSIFHTHNVSMGLNPRLETSSTNLIFEGTGSLWLYFVGSTDLTNLRSTPGKESKKKRSLPIASSGFFAFITWEAS